MKCIKNTSKKLAKLTERMYHKYLDNLYKHCMDHAKQGLHFIMVDVKKIDGVDYTRTGFEQYVPYEIVKEYFEARGYKIELLPVSDWSTSKTLYIRW